MSNEQAELVRLRKELDDLKREFHDYKTLRQHEELKRLRTALVAAGGIILALGAFLWWEILWPTIKAVRTK